MFFSEIFRKALQQQVFVAHVILEVFMMCKEMFDASFGGFPSGGMCLVESGDLIPFKSSIFDCSIFWSHKSWAFNLVMNSSKVLGNECER